MPDSQDAALTRLLADGAYPDPGADYWAAFPDRVAAAARGTAAARQTPRPDRPAFLPQMLLGLRFRFTMWLTLLQERPLEGMLPLMLGAVVIWQSFDAVAWLGLDITLRERFLRLLVRIVP